MSEDRLQQAQLEILELAIRADVPVLEEALGRELSLAQLGISPRTPTELRELARAYLQDHSRAVRAAICRPSVIEQVNSVVANDFKKAAVLLIDALAGVMGGVPVVYASVLILRRSLNIWCNDIEASS
jgi:hypothetical protein